MTVVSIPTVSVPPPDPFNLFLIEKLKGVKLILRIISDAVIIIHTETKDIDLENVGKYTPSYDITASGRWYVKDNGKTFEIAQTKYIQMKKGQTYVFRFNFEPTTNI